MIIVYTTYDVTPGIKTVTVEQSGIITEINRQVPLLLVVQPGVRCLIIAHLANKQLTD